MSTLKFYLGQFEDDFTLKQFRTLVMQTRPVEFICTSGVADPANIRCQQSLKILMNSPSPPSKTTLSLGEASHPEKILVRCLGEDRAKWQKDLTSVCGKGQETQVALGLTLVFLDKLLLLDSTLPVSSFEYCEGIGFDKNKAMLIDAQAIEHLDILPVKQQGPSAKQDMSLLGVLSFGVRTAFGKRMLRRWVVSPLTDKE